jgi:hypothetical protein
MQVAKAQNWAVEPQEKKNWLYYYWNGQPATY